MSAQGRSYTGIKMHLTPSLLRQSRGWVIVDVQLQSIPSPEDSRIILYPSIKVWIFRRCRVIQERGMKRSGDWAGRQTVLARGCQKFPSQTITSQRKVWSILISMQLWCAGRRHYTPEFTCHFTADRRLDGSARYLSLGRQNWIVHHCLSFFNVFGMPLVTTIWSVLDACVTAAT